MQGRRHRQASKKEIGRARTLRRESTFPERLLWSRLRHQLCGGLNFRRQQPLGEYVVDYFCPSAHLVVELDGMSHEGRSGEDRKREEALRVLGMRVIRFTNDEVLKDLDGVVARIKEVADREKA